MKILNIMYRECDSTSEKKNKNKKGIDKYR